MAMQTLVDAYSGHAPTLENIARFHVRFETIHPFADGNGRVGRAIMFRECLRAGVIPFIVMDRSKDSYYAGLDAFRYGEDRLIDYFRDMQREYLHLSAPLLDSDDIRERLGEYIEIDRSPALIDPGFTDPLPSHTSADRDRDDLPSH